MSVLSSTRPRALTRLAVGGAATAMIAAGLVGGAGTAHAATSATYTCGIPGLFEAPFTVDVDDLALPEAVPAGVPVGAGLVPVSAVFGVPASIAGLLAGYGVTGGGSPDFSVLIGDTALPVENLDAGSLSALPDGGVSMPATGSNGAFVTPLPGTYDITMPETFSLVPTGLTGAIATLACSTEAPEVLGQLMVVKQPSQLSVGDVVGKKSKKVSVPVAVSNLTSNATGKVVAKLGKKKLASKPLKDGAAKLSLPAFKKPGTYTVTVDYLGDALTDAATDTVTVTVKK